MSTLTTAMDAFVEEELKLFAEYLKRQARERIIRMRIRVDDALLNSLATQVAANELKLLFADQGRFRDMGAGRAYHKGKYTGNRKNVALLKGRKPKKWYSPMAYGAVYGTLVNNLSNKYVQTITDGLRSEITAP